MIGVGDAFRCAEGSLMCTWSLMRAEILCMCAGGV